MGNLSSTLGTNLAKKCANSHLNVPLNCAISFTDSSNSTVVSFGDVDVGQFKLEPDVAGIGVRFSTSNWP